MSIVINGISNGVFEFLMHMLATKSEGETDLMNGLGHLKSSG